MRAHRARAGVISASLQHHDGLNPGNPTRLFDESGTILDAFQIHGYDAHIRVIPKIGNHIRLGNIHLVPQAGKMGKTDLGFKDEVHNTAANSA